ncbi:MAG: TolC family protein [Bacteroidota bacterium]
MRNYQILLILTLLLLRGTLAFPQAYDLKGCIGMALENNQAIKKAEYDQQKSRLAGQEVLGALLPQVSLSGNLNYTIQKNSFIMPNFLKEFLPEQMLGGQVQDYLTIEMGMNWSSSLGVTLNQQLLNFSLFSALDISRLAENLSALGVESKQEEVVSQTATLYYGIQVTSYVDHLFSKSLGILDSLLQTMETNYVSGIVRKVDVDRLWVTRTNMETQEKSLRNAVEVQKNLLKLQMGVDVSLPLNLENEGLADFEKILAEPVDFPFAPSTQTAFKVLETQEEMLQLQRRSVLSASLPVLVAVASYNYNGVSEEFFRGETNYWYPYSFVGLNLKVPIFSGLTNSKKLKEADIELLKVREDRRMLEQSLNMAYRNAVMKLEESRNSIYAQRDNMKLAEEVYRITSASYAEGLASLTDMLNANSSMIQAQMSYADALSSYLKALIDLKKAAGTINTLSE